MMWNIFKRAPKPVIRFKYVDWDRVKTVKDIVSILKVLPDAKIRALESSWNLKGVQEFLGDETYIQTDQGYKLEE